MAKLLTDEFEKKIKDLLKGNVLNIGCGDDYVEGWVNLDFNKKIRADAYAELGKEQLPFKDKMFDGVLCCHVLEHIPDLVYAKKEISRVMISGGRLLVLVPYYLSPDAWGDDTHCRAFSHHSFIRNFWEDFDGAKGTCELVEPITSDNETLTWVIASLIRK